VETAATDGLF